MADPKAPSERAAESEKGWSAKLGDKCCECRAGEHADLAPGARLCVVKDPDTGRVFKRGWLCPEHVYAMNYDGYLVYVDGRRLQ